MRVGDRRYRTVWWSDGRVCMIDQNRLPFEFGILACDTHEDTARAIATMAVRGAGAIGAAAGFGVAQAFREAPTAASWDYVAEARRRIEATRPTARNLFHATSRVFDAARRADEPREAARREAMRLADEDARASRRIGWHGAALVAHGARVATHCNAGWLAFVDYGTALAPVYCAHRQGKQPHVLVDETRPRGQGGRLTAWELGAAGVAHTVIADNALAYFMSRGEVDLVIVGADRIAANGDTANKIGTLEKALAARAFGVPFYVAAPHATFDTACASGADIAIEEREPDELLWQTGRTSDGRLETVLVCAPGSPARNPAFDVTPAPLITAFITDRGVFPADAAPVGSQSFASRTHRKIPNGESCP